jgi:hypothetical protein
MARDLDDYHRGPFPVPPYIYKDSHLAALVDKFEEWKTGLSLHFTARHPQNISRLSRTQGIQPERALRIER